MPFPGEEVQLTGDDNGKGFPGTVVDLNSEFNQAGAPDTGIADIFTGSERIAATPELGTLPRFGASPEGDTLGITLGLLSTFDEQGQRDIIKNFIPEAQFQITPDGSTIIEVPTETGETRRTVLNRPGFSKQDLTTGLAQVLSFVPAARLSALGSSLLKRVGIGALGSAATEQGLQEAGVALGRQDRDPAATLIAGGIGGIAETAVPVVQGFRQGRQARQLDAAQQDLASVVEQVQPAREAVSGLEEGIGVKVDLFQAQQTLQPSTLLKQRLLPQLDAGARRAAAELERQNKQVFDATSELIGTIAPDQVVESGSQRFRNAAKKALDARRQRRSAAVKGLYDDALNEGAAVDLTTVKGLIADLLEEAPPGGQFASVGRRLQNLITVKGASVNDEAVNPTLRQLQKAKIEMQDMIDAVGEKAVSTTLKREIVQVRQELITKMREASELFGQAEDEFIRLSPAVKELEDSILGAVGKVKDKDLKTIAGKIFDATESNPAVIRNAKKVINDIDPGAWDDLLRVEFQRRFGGLETVADDLPGELVGNLPAQIRRAIFGNAEKRRTLLSGMTREQRRNFVFLDEVLRRASAGRQAGSPTAPFQQAIEKLRGVSVVLRDMLFRPLDTLRRTGESKVFDSNVAKLTDVLFNPKWEPTLKQLRGLNPNSDEAGRVFAELMNVAKSSGQLLRQENE